MSIRIREFAQVVRRTDGDDVAGLFLSQFSCASADETLAEQVYRRARAQVAEHVIVADPLSIRPFADPLKLIR